MIKRIWHGWTSAENADAYEALLKAEVFPGIRAKKIPGYLGISLWRNDAGDEVEFVTIMSFESYDSVVSFMGNEPSRSYVPDKARALLSHWDSHSAHYEVREDIHY